MISMPALASETDVRASSSRDASLTISYSVVAGAKAPEDFPAFFAALKRCATPSPESSATAAPRDFARGAAFTIPQWPCDMYSQRQTSPIRRRPGTSRLMARAACCTMPFSAQAPVATSSFLSGRPKRITDGTPSE